MTNTVVTINGAQPALPTLLGQGPVRIPAGGKIRAGIKVLTKKAAGHPKAKEIYERGVAANQSPCTIPSSSRLPRHAQPGLRALALEARCAAFPAPAPAWRFVP